MKMKDELVEKVAKALAMERYQYCEWIGDTESEDFLAAENVDEFVKKNWKHFISPAKAALSAMEASELNATAPSGRGLPNKTNKAVSEASASEVLIEKLESKKAVYNPLVASTGDERLIRNAVLEEVIAIIREHSASEAQGEVDEYLAQNMLMAFIDGREGRQVTNYAGSQKDEDGMRNVLAFLIQKGYLRTPPAASKEE
jgi:hypothetical protein